MKGTFYLLVLLSLGCRVSFGQALQSTTLSTLPPSIRWQQINSEHFKVIFTEGFEAEANRITNMLEGVYVPGSQSLGKSPRKFPVVLQNYHGSSNGFVTIGPFRSELFTMSPQQYTSTGNDQWMEHLVSHEYRHMVQFEKALSKFNKFMFYLFGEYGAGAAAALAAPSWFFEGDAVGAETAMGRSGRGRTPSFLMPFKANLIEKGGFNYYKQHLTSFRDFVPNHYVTGYLMTTHIKNEYGADIWDKITHDSFRHPYIPFTFSNAIKKNTGNYLVPAYKEMLSHQKELYSSQLSKIETTPFDQINHRKNDEYTNYSFPQGIENNQVLAIKEGMGDIYQLVKLDSNNEEQTVAKLGYFNDTGYLSANDSVVVWTESEFDPRWFKRSYLVIKKLNIRDPKIVRLTHKSRYTSAAISSDSRCIIATHQSENSENHLHLLDAQTGELIKAFQNPENEFYSMPSFDESGENIVVLKQHQDGKQIILKSVETGLEEEIFFANQEIIGHPVFHDGMVYYNSTFNGVDNIYCINIDSKESFQVTHSQFGAFNPAFSKSSNQMLYNDYTADGMDIVSTDLDSQNWLPKNQTKYVGVDFEKTMVENENIADHLYDIPQKEYTIEKYPKVAKSIRPVTWGLQFIPGVNDYAFGLLSRDVLSTTAFDAMIRYNTAERAWRSSLDVSYQGLYPILDIGADLGSRSALLPDANDIEQRYYWHENTLKAGYRIPLLLTHSKYSRSLSFGSAFEYSRVTGYNAPVRYLNQTGNGDLYVLTHFASFSNVLRQSKLDIGPRWGQSLRLSFKQTPFGGDYVSTLFGAESNLYFPSLFKHHSIRLRGSYQYQEIDDYAFLGAVNYVRGYLYTPYDHYTGFSANYKLPLVCMDFHIGPLLNIQRIYTNLFYDYGLGQTQGKSDQQLQSFGAEVSVNFNAMRFLYLFDIGVRYSYLPDRNTGVLQLMIGSISF